MRLNMATRINPLLVSVAVVLCIIGLYHVPSLFPQKTISMKRLLAACVDLAERGGEKVRSIKHTKKLNAASKGLTKEGKKELKTDGDMQSHIEITRGFRMVDPDLQVISEEHENLKYESVRPPKETLVTPDFMKMKDDMVALRDITVWIDPLDATQEYTEDLDEYVTVMVCVAVRGRPVMGVIHRPLSSKGQPKQTVWAWDGHGHSDDLEYSRKKAEAKPEDKPVVIVSRSHAGNVADVAKEAFEGAVVKPAGGAGYKTLELFRNKANLYAHVTRIKKWDICAGNALLNSFGGKMTTLSGEVIDYSGGSTPVNDGGLLASLSQHAVYLHKLGPAFTKLHEQGEGEGHH